MNGFGLGYWLLVLIFTLALFYPYVRIIQKAGYSGWWVLVGLVPLVNFIMLWVFALADWPALRGERQT
ncbi:MAG: hypothetical protein ABSF50_19235 [Burkholderiaceae bacterium]|jgi:uncharacterized membrane protein YhaH (DUF805 family)